MKRIAAPEEPACFAAYREASPDASWERFRQDAPDCVAELWRALIDAQLGLCAFCEIDLERPLWSQVEHWHPKDPAVSQGHNWGLDFANLMAGCEGGERDKPDRGRALPPIKRTRHCGPAKANRVLVDVLLDPRVDVPDGVSLWTFDAVGAMGISGDAGVLASRAQATIDLLNLDSLVLRRLRAALWEELNRDVLAVWEALGGGDPAYLEALDVVAASRLAVEEGRLRRFWSTIRAFFGDVAEAWLAKAA